MGRFVLIEPNKKYLQELNPVASRLWSLLKTPTTTDKLIKSISKEYKINQKTATKDINDWVNGYLKKGLLTKLD
jgi:ubiquitin-protein ligase